MTAAAAQGLAAAQPLSPRLAIGAFLLFCRIGGCLMLAPGFSSSPDPDADPPVRRALGDAGACAACCSTRIPASALGDDPVLTLRHDRGRDADRRYDRLSRPHLLRRARDAGLGRRADARLLQSVRRSDRGRRTARAARHPDLARRDDADVRRRSALGASARARRVLRRHAGRRRLQFPLRAASRSSTRWANPSASRSGSCRPT